MKINLYPELDSLKDDDLLLVWNDETSTTKKIKASTLKSYIGIVSGGGDVGKLLTFNANGDTNGVFYWMGTSNGIEPWSNPSDKGLIIGASSVGAGNPTSLVDRSDSEFYTGNQPNSWISFYLNGKTLKCKQYYFSDKKTKKFESDLVPIEVETIQPNSLGVCWRFFGQGVNNSAFYELFACGKSPYFKFNGIGFDLYMDGVQLGGSEYYYRSGTNSVSRVDKMVPTPGLVTSGNCDCLAECEIKVIKDNKVIFSDKGACPLKFNITCDDDCPENSHKCKHNKYPGYCCVPCKEVGDRLKNMAAKVGR